MKFSIFKSARAQKGELCTRQLYVDTANAQWLLRLCNDIAAEQDADKRGELKKKLPVITWQAFFEGRRLNKEAQPSGLFMLDIDHVTILARYGPSRLQPVLRNLVLCMLA